MSKKRSVGLILFTSLPGIDDLVAVLQVRGAYNFEMMRLESYPGGCQVTAHGAAARDEEDLVVALLREIKEELGMDVMLSVKELHTQGIMKLLTTIELPEKEVKTYGALIEANALKDIALHPSSGGLRFITSMDAKRIHNLQDYSKKYGVTVSDTTAMFPDEAEAVRKGFERFT